MSTRASDPTAIISDQVSGIQTWETVAGIDEIIRQLKQAENDR